MQARLPLTGTLHECQPQHARPVRRAEAHRPPARHLSRRPRTRWARTSPTPLAELGVVDTGVVADTASYGVFCSGGSLPGCVGGARSYSAYNPTDAPVTVTFRDADTRAPVATLQVPALAQMTLEGSGNVVTDTLTPPTADAQRLYLGKPTSFSAACRRPGPSPVLPLTTTPGTLDVARGQHALPQRHQRTERFDRVRPWPPGPQWHEHAAGSAVRPELAGHVQRRHGQQKTSPISTSSPTRACSPAGNWTPVWRVETRVPARLPELRRGWGRAIPSAPTPSPCR